MLNIVTIDGIKMVSSLELYKKIGLSPEQYARWYNSYILKLGIEGTDFLDKEKNFNKFPLSPLKPGRRQREFYLNIYYVIGLCLAAKTTQAKRIRLWLLTVI